MLLVQKQLKMMDAAPPMRQPWTSTGSVTRYCGACALEVKARDRLEEVDERDAPWPCSTRSRSSSGARSGRDSRAPARWHGEEGQQAVLLEEEAKRTHRSIDEQPDEGLQPKRHVVQGADARLLSDEARQDPSEEDAEEEACEDDREGRRAPLGRCEVAGER